MVSSRIILPKSEKTDALVEAIAALGIEHSVERPVIDGRTYLVIDLSVFARKIVEAPIASPT